MYIYIYVYVYLYIYIICYAVHIYPKALPAPNISYKGHGELSYIQAQSLKGQMRDMHGVSIVFDGRIHVVVFVYEHIRVFKEN